MASDGYGSPKASWKDSDDATAKQEVGVWPLDEHNVKLLDNVHPRGWQNPCRGADFVYDLIAIGGGAAGLVSAKQSARRGARSALIESHLAGGDCLNVGCVPSKALLRCARAVHERSRSSFGLPAADVAIDFAKVMERMRRLRAKIAPVDSFEGTVAAGADMYVGRARFTGAHELEVGGQVLRFKKAVICTGGRAMVPDKFVPGLKEAPYHTNATLFNLSSLPPRLLIVGAGPIGCEMAQAFARFGSKVTIVDMLPQILGPEDPEAASVLQESLLRDGVKIIVGARVERVEHTPAAGADAWPTIKVFAKVGESTETLECEVLLIAAGRVPNVEGIGLEAAGVKYHPSRGIEIDDQLHTSNPDILAIGDCCDKPQARFTHMSGTMAGMAVQNALFDGEGLPVNAPSCKLSDVIVPRCTYTEPEVASVGLNAASAKAAGIEVDEYRSTLEHNDRCILEESPQGGYSRIFCRKGTEEIVGGVIVSEHAGEMLAEITLAIQNKIGLSSLARTVHPYPTMGEVVQQAALNFNRANWKRFKSS
eukprot:TRINITY_DN405_c0_g1_i2.p1 TRINITY_DN405_c0_g1~~TRINITY_DN405_c0_g1_i2.p1  ORF type:complete len:537 (-),score=104.04 TRINITY_DN405_c0_g1_i2:251-1861(-)